jgi:hypothetical protein
VPTPACACQQTERQLKQAADQQRYGDQQAELAIGQRQVTADQRQGGGLGAVDELVDEFDAKGGRQSYGSQPVRTVRADVLRSRERHLDMVARHAVAPTATAPRHARAAW